MRADKPSAGSPSFGICSFQWWSHSASFGVCSHRKASKKLPLVMQASVVPPAAAACACSHRAAQPSFPLPCSQSIIAVTRPLPGTGLAGVGEVLKWEQVSLAPAEDAAAAAEASGRQAMDTNGTGGLLLHQLS